MLWIENDDLTAIRQRSRTGTTRPLIRRRPQKTFPSLSAETCYLIEINYQEICKTRERERVQRRILTGTSEIAQRQRPQFVLSPLFTRR